VWACPKTIRPLLYLGLTRQANEHASAVIDVVIHLDRRYLRVQRVDVARHEVITASCSVHIVGQGEEIYEDLAVIGNVAGGQDIPRQWRFAITGVQQKAGHVQISAASYLA